MDTIERCPLCGAANWRSAIYDNTCPHCGYNPEVWAQEARQLQEAAAKRAKRRKSSKSKSTKSKKQTA